MGLVCLILIISCRGKKDSAPIQEIDKKEDQQESSIRPIVNTVGSTIFDRFSPPQSFVRKEVNDESFASYLRNFSLLDAGEEVHLYNGQLKGNQDVHVSILNIDVGNRDLQQCADAVMRLRAEYLLEQEMYEDISFNFTNGWKFEYSKWREGNSLFVDGNKTKWIIGTEPKESYEDFRSYMDWVFMFAGTLSLSKEMTPKKLEDIQIGDVFIYGGSPGHAVLVVDLAVNELTDDKAFMLAQSYMPAQQIHILKNPANRKMSPWYLVSEIGSESKLITPEWTFESKALKGF